MSVSNVEGRASGGERQLRAERAPPAEATEMHTRILRCMLAVDDCAAYWRHFDRVHLCAPPAENARVAFAERWFGTKSEARVRTIMTDMSERFDMQPLAFRALHDVGTVPARLRPLICHFHTQLADPIYRRFTGDLLPSLRAQGRTSLDRPAVARWIESIAPGRWSAPTAMKFASNLLAAAHDAGLVAAKRDPRKVTLPNVPPIIVGWILYVLRDTVFEGSLVDNAYLRSLGIDRAALRAVAPRISGLRLVELGGAAELSFEAASIVDWAPSAFAAFERAS